MAKKYPTETETGVTLRGCVCPATSAEPQSQTVLLRHKKYRERPQVSDSMMVCRLMKAEGDRPQEDMTVLHLDNQNRIVSRQLIARGTRSEAAVDPAAVFQGAILANATRIILVHNHPSGSAQASPADVALTRRLVEAGELLAIPVLDHIIVGDGECNSFRDRGIIGKGSK